MNNKKNRIRTCRIVSYQSKEIHMDKIIFHYNGGTEEHKSGM